MSAESDKANYVPLFMRGQSFNQMVCVLERVVADWTREDDDAVKAAGFARMVANNADVELAQEPDRFAQETGRDPSLYGPALRLSDRLHDLSDPRRPSLILAEYVAEQAQQPVTAEEFEPARSGLLPTGYYSGIKIEELKPAQYLQLTLTAKMDAAEAGILRLVKMFEGGSPTPPERAEMHAFVQRARTLVDRIEAALS